MTGTDGPLSGIRVLDFTQLLQGPMATQILGDFGADVIKIEKVGGEWMRSWGIMDARTEGEMDSFLAFNRNKRSVEADLRDAPTRDALLEMARDADVVVENFRPGVMERLGFGYEDCSRVNPSIIYASSNGYGSDGPYKTRPGQDLLIQAMSGALFLTGRDSDPPMACGIGLSDEFTSTHLVIAILGALVHRQRTGEGQRVEVDLLSCTIAAQAQELTVHLNRSGEVKRPRANVGHIGATAPFGIYPTADGWLTLAMMPCPRLGEILGVDWLDEFDTNEKMFERRDEIHDLLSSHFGTDATSHWLDLLDRHDVWCAPVQDYEALEDDPHVAHYSLFWDVPVGDGGESAKTIGSPFRFSKTPVSLRRGVPRSGQHSGDLGWLDREGP